MPARTEFILYRWWDAEGHLLYVGKSVSVYARVASHRRGSEFFAEAATMTIERFPDAVALGDAEVAAIRTERPLFNRAHSVGGGGPRARKLIVLNEMPPVPGTNVGHWEHIDPDHVWPGDIIRFGIADDRVEIQGIVDDDWYDDDAEEYEAEELRHGWTVLCDTGAVSVLTRFQVHLGWLHRWVSVLEDDPLRQGILGAYYDGIRAEIAERVVA